MHEFLEGGEGLRAKLVHKKLGDLREAVLSVPSYQKAAGRSLAFGYPYACFEVPYRGFPNTRYKAQFKFESPLFTYNEEMFLFWGPKEKFDEHDIFVSSHGGIWLQTTEHPGGFSFYRIEALGRGQYSDVKKMSFREKIARVDHRIDLLKQAAG